MEGDASPNCRYSAIREINCVIHWYQSWSSHYKQLFLNDLLEKALPNKVDLLLNAFDGMNVQEQQPPSIFECQLRLFGQWFNEWTDDERNSMINKLEAFDPDLVAKFHELIRQSKTLS